MDYLAKFKVWKDSKFFDKDIRDELKVLEKNGEKKEIEDRFYRDLEFGTAGIRGVMGAGTNRMNKYTVGKATLGFGRFLVDRFGKNVCKKRGVVVCYDTRNNSKSFSEITANVLSSLGIRVFVFKHARPIPEMSYTISKLKALGGVMITASHNPREYNGYKVYDESGCQLTPKLAETCISFVRDVENYEEIDFSGNKNLIEEIDLTEEFVNVVLKQSRLGDKKVKAGLKIVYSALHGAGLVPVVETLKKDGFNVDVVPEQAEPDGNFPTVASPNPEDKRALEMGIELAKKVDADIVVGTDPDCDRVGVAVKTKSGFELISGNQMGALLVDFLLKTTNISKLKKPAIIKSIVTSELGSVIAKKYGVLVFQTLTGFKYIGSIMNIFKQAKQSGDNLRDYDFLMGYEESYGYLVGMHSRDKDAVVSSMLICEMTAKAKAEGKTLIDLLDEIYLQFGFCFDAQDSFTLKGKDGLEQIAGMMQKLRINGSPFKDCIKILDYSKPVRAEIGFGYCETSNVLKYIFKDESWIAVRPSGTEPKIKIYYSIKGKDKKQATKRFENYQKQIKDFLGL